MVILVKAAIKGGQSHARMSYAEREQWLWQKNVVKVVKVKMVIFIFGFGHLLTIYKYKIFII